MPLSKFFSLYYIYIYMSLGCIVIRMYTFWYQHCNYSTYHLVISVFIRWVKWHEIYNNTRNVLFIILVVYRYVCVFVCVCLCVCASVYIYVCVHLRLCSRVRGCIRTHPCTNPYEHVGAPLKSFDEECLYPSANYVHKLPY